MPRQRRATQRAFVKELGSTGTARKFFAKDLIKRATGAELSPEPYLAYLQKKFGEIYGIREAIARAHEG